MRKALKDDGTPYWELVLLYVDDVLCISCYAEEIIKSQIGRYFIVKPGSVEAPTLYLGNKVSKVTLQNNVEAWAFSSSQYFQNAVSNVERYLHSQGNTLPRRATAPLCSSYCPEVDGVWT